MFGTEEEPFYTFLIREHLRVESSRFDVLIDIPGVSGITPSIEIMSVCNTDEPQTPVPNGKPMLR